MGARWLQAKKTKLRRAWFKRPKPMPAHGWTRQYKDAVCSISRAAVAEMKLADLIQLRDSYRFRMLPYDEQLELYEKIRLLERHMKELKTAPQMRGATVPMRARTEALHKMWAGEQRQWGIENYHAVEIFKGLRPLTLYFGGTEFFFVKKDLMKRTYRRSISFGSREDAYWYLEHPEAGNIWQNEQTF